jgi:hypothetical protein
MAGRVGPKGDYKNKYGKITNTTYMHIIQVPLEAIVVNGGYKNIKIFQRYNHINFLKAC